MQRHRRDHVGLGDELRARARHPGRNGPREIRAIGIFEPMHEPPNRPVLEAGHRAGATEHRRISDRLRRQQALAEILLERRAEPIAEGLFNETHIAPTGRTQGAAAPNRRPAGQTGRRIEDIQRRAAGRQRPVTKAPRPGRRAACFGVRKGHFAHDHYFSAAGAIAREGGGPHIGAVSAPAAPLFDRALLNRRLDRALRGGAVASGADFLLQRAAQELDERLAIVSRVFPDAADVGTPGPQGAQTLAARREARTTLRVAPTALSAGFPGALVGDFERLPLAPGSVDLVVSLLALQHANDLTGALIQMRMALRPDGLALVALIGGETLTELRQALTTAESEITGGAAPRVAPFADVRAIGGLLQRAGFALPVVDSDRATVRYRDLGSLMHDLRAFGAANALTERSRRPLTRGILALAEEIYRDRFADSDGRLRATFETLWITGWAPHESQPKPLKPGSAAMRLEDAIKAARGAGEP